MSPNLKAFLLSWDWRLDVIIILMVVGIIYGRGWKQLPAPLATGWRLISYYSGLILIALALISPIDIFGGQFFFMHMIQHLLLVMFVPPLLLLADPFPFLLWGLPKKIRSQIASLFKPRSSFRQTVQFVTRPGISWILFIVVFIGWHDPNAYNAALESDLVHDLEHITFFGTAMLYWWHVVPAAPRLHKRLVFGAQMAYLIAVVPINMFTGVAITFSTEPIYTYYTAVPRLWGISVMKDQMLGGIIMWIPGSMMYLIAALVLVARLFRGEEDKQPLPEAIWATDENMIAPGLEKRY